MKLLKVASLWPVEQLADGPVGCGEETRFGCSFAGNCKCDKRICAYGRLKNGLYQSRRCRCVSNQLLD